MDWHVQLHVHAFVATWTSHCHNGHAPVAPPFPSANNPRLILVCYHHQNISSTPPALLYRMDQLLKANPFLVEKQNLRLLHASLPAAECDTQQQSVTPDFCAYPPLAVTLTSKESSGRTHFWKGIQPAVHAGKSTEGYSPTSLPLPLTLALSLSTPLSLPLSLFSPFLSLPSQLYLPPLQEDRRLSHRICSPIHHDSLVCNQPPRGVL